MSTEPRVQCRRASLLTGTFAVIVEVLEKNRARIDRVHIAGDTVMQFAERSDFRAIIARCSRLDKA